MRAGRVAALTAALAIGSAAFGAETVAAAAAVRARVVVIAVPDLRWADVADMPRLQEWARTAAAGELSVKTASGPPRCASGEVTFNAGDRADASSMSGCAVTPAAFRAIRAEARSSQFAADPGALGQALRAAGLRTAAVGDEARALLADETGHVDELADLPTALRAADVVAAVDEQLYAALPAARASAARSLDAVLADQLGQVPSEATVVVAGISDGAHSGMHLHALLIRGAGWPHQALRSPSTRAPFVQLTDLAPTLLGLLHVPAPSVMAGRAAYATSKAVASPASYADDDAHAVGARAVGRVLRVVLAYVVVAVLLLLFASAWLPSAYGVGATFAALVVGAPVATFLVQVVPWWRWSLWFYGPLVAFVSVAIGALVIAARRRSLRLALLLGPAVTAAVLIGDQFLGAPLQLSAPLGDNPIIAGRFHGMGNTDFAFMCTSMLLCAGCVAPLLSRRRGVAVAALLCALAIVVDVAPPLGDDFGGLLSMLPAAVLLVALVAGLRLTWRRLMAGALGVGAVAVAVALADYARPAQHQTHVGQFVGHVLHGGAGTVIRRKLDSSLGSFSSPAPTSLVGVMLLGLAIQGRRIWDALRGVSGLVEAVMAMIPLAVLGTFLNDSGVVVGAGVITIAALAIGASGVRRPEAARDHEDVLAPARGSSP